MKRSIFLVGLGIAISFCVTTSPSLAAGSARTWVSGVGSDANPCSRTAPCLTFAGALVNTIPGGEIDALDCGGFGTVTISQALIIDGGSVCIASILASGGANAIVITGTAATDKVILRNLSLNGDRQTGGSGIVVNGALQALSIENCNIENFGNLGIDFEPTSKSNLVISDTNVENALTGGLFVNFPGGSASSLVRANVRRSTFSRSTYGIRVSANSQVSISNSFVGPNGTSGGLLADQSTALVTMFGSTVANNQTFGLHATSSARIFLGLSSVTSNNGTGLLADGGGTIVSNGNNMVAGNAIDGSPSSTVTTK
jgi:hypothetical protein